jgi:hypothetical protein
MKKRKQLDSLNSGSESHDFDQRMRNIAESGIFMVPGFCFVAINATEKVSKDGEAQ